MRWRRISELFGQRPYDREEIARKYPVFLVVCSSLNTIIGKEAFAGDLNGGALATPQTIIVIFQYASGGQFFHNDFICYLWWHSESLAELDLSNSIYSDKTVID